MLLKAITLGILTVTSYRAVPSQTKETCYDNDNCFTAINEPIHSGGVAVSRDLLCPYCKKLHRRCNCPVGEKLHYGDWIFIEGYGFRQVNDIMGAYTTGRIKGKKVRIPIKNQVDIFVNTWKEEHSVGVKHLNVFKIKETLK